MMPHFLDGNMQLDKRKTMNVVVLAMGVSFTHTTYFTAARCSKKNVVSAVEETVQCPRQGCVANLCENVSCPQCLTLYAPEHEGSSWYGMSDMTGLRVFACSSGTCGVHRTVVRVMDIIASICSLDHVVCFRDEHMQSNTSCFSVPSLGCFA